MPGNWSIVTRADGSILTASIYNQDNQLPVTFATPGGLDDYSTNVAQMQSAADPGEVGTESLPTDLAGELQRIRKILTEITGKTYWYQSPDSSIVAQQVIDGTFRVIGSSDATKKLAFEVDGFTTAQVRTITPPDRSGAMMLETTTVSYASTDTLGLGVGLALLSGASFAFGLPPAASHPGREVTIIHRGTSLSQLYTLTGNAAENIIAKDGTANTYILYTNGELVRLKSNGTGWDVLYHDASTDWVDVGAMTITGTTSDPTKPTTPDIDKVYWRRVGNQVFLRYILQISSAAGGAAGSGNYVFALPTNVTFDSTVMAPVATVLAGATRSEASPSFLSGVGMAGIDTSSFNQCTFYAKTTGSFQLYVSGTINNELGSGTGLGLNNAELSYNFELNARAANWRL